MMLKIVEKDGSVIFSVRLVPRASVSEIVGEHDGAVKVRIAAPPVDGAANAELIRLLAKTFKVPKGDIEIISGQTSRSKQVRIDGITATEFSTVLKAKT